MLVDDAYNEASQPCQSSTHTPLAVQVQGSDAATGDGDLFGGPAAAATDGGAERPRSGRLGSLRACQQGKQ